MQKWPEKGDNKEKVKEIHKGGGDKVEEVDKWSSKHLSSLSSWLCEGRGPKGQCDRRRNSTGRAKPNRTELSWAIKHSTRSRHGDRLTTFTQRGVSEGGGTDKHWESSSMSIRNAKHTCRQVGRLLFWPFSGSMWNFIEKCWRLNCNWRGAEWKVKWGAHAGHLTEGRSALESRRVESSVVCRVRFVSSSAR